MSIPARISFFLITLLALAAQAAPIPAPPQIAASGYLLLDMHSGRVLAEQNSNQRLEPASLTKILTADVVLREIKAGNLRLEDQVLVSEKAWRTPGSRMFIEVGKRVSVEELLKGMIIASGNDAAVALAEHVAGSEETFAAMMNDLAKKLGMNNSHFTNATGLPHDDHYTTPADIAKAAMATIREFPEFYAWYKIKSYKYNNIKQNNRNRMLWRDESVDGIKTGHTEAAGYCLVASAKRDDMRLISVVMGTANDAARANETQKLLNYGFRFYETHRLYGAGDTLSRARVWKGETEALPIGLAEDLYVTIPRRQYKNLNAAMKLEQPIEAPIAKGQVMGKAIISLNGETVAERPLVALADVPEAGIFGRLSDSVRLWFE